ncbi:chorismate synthase [Streptococcus halichoeri]|uniref:chorismate synthase n=1 Tax=Streptococcus halichoeri TaxID=254785 RepID=UPI00135C2867|nr:chorismate synthase [Streptococcus halichoeri]
MRYLTAGESHGPSLTAIIEGIPAGLSLPAEAINHALKRRQGGYGRGARMAIEKDQVEISSGVRHGQTTGGPITLTVHNKDHQKWLEVMAVEDIPAALKGKRRVSRPRPGHADLVGGMKFHHRDLRNALERSSARETTMRVAVGAVCQLLLADVGIQLVNHVLVFGGQEIVLPDSLDVATIRALTAQSELGIVNPDQEASIKAQIDAIKKEGDTIGGIIETVVEGVPAGLGDYSHWDKKLDGKLAQAVLSINAFKGVDFGMGFSMGHLKGSQVMDEIIWTKEKGYSRKTNHLGGFEGGVTNGQPLIIHGVMKPIPTLYKPLMSVDIDSHEPYKATVERSDPTALPAAGVVMEHVVATVLAQELLASFPAASMEDLRHYLHTYRQYLKDY